MSVFISCTVTIIQLEEIVLKRISMELALNIVVGIIELIIIILFIDLPVLVFIFIFIVGSFIPYLSLIIFFKNKGINKLTNIKIVIGTLLIGIGYILTLELIDSMSIIIPIFYIIGVLIIIESYKTNLF